MTTSKRGLVPKANDSIRSQTRSLVFVGVLALALFGFATAALGHGFGAGTTPAHYVGDSTFHNWRNSESNAGESNTWDPRVDAMMSMYITDTDLTGTETTTHGSSRGFYVDISWWVTPIPNFGATASCDKWYDSSASPPECDHNHVRFDGGDWSDTFGRNYAACHEIGHTVGFDDSLWGTGGKDACMEDFVVDLDTHMINNINAHY